MKRLSPTASLLKTSRLFSLPPPLPRPSHDFTATSIFDSDTATLPYPTHAAIETTQSSLSRGDWGLKRPLPQKSTNNTSTPSIRIEDIDSIDHITEFESAADHALTLRKWQEIGLPVSMPVVQKGAMKSHEMLNTRRTPPTSVFEAAYDNTERQDGASNASRWKFQGPWLAGKTEGNFVQYLERHIKRRKLEFRNFVHDRLGKEKTLDRRRNAQERGESVVGEVEVTEEEVDFYLKQLRRDEVGLYKLVEDFLDLPVSVDPQEAAGTFVVMMNSDKGPPKTHLSAGLSYLRTASHMTNHPVLGPMEEEPPVRARILRPQRTSAVKKHYCALLGIGGVAVEDVTVRTGFMSNQDPRGRREKPGIQSFDAEIEGGAKLWVLPDRASIDPHGRVKVHALRVTANDEAIYEGIVPEVKEVEVTRQPHINPQYETMPRLDSPRYSRPGSSSGYGLSMNDARQNSNRASPLNVPQGSTDSRQGLLDLLDSTSTRRS
ncbi:MAG: hypothetical protein L6R40_000107 [Gallowayella cf. fulva]|nr:MAG: hypothetical protein L6R40_000107 [Xanthomendoza cf. fulva]